MDIIVLITVNANLSIQTTEKPNSDFLLLNRKTHNRSLRLKGKDYPQSDSLINIQELSRLLSFLLF